MTINDPNIDIAKEGHLTRLIRILKRGDGRGIFGLLNAASLHLGQVPVDSGNPVPTEPVPGSKVQITEDGTNVAGVVQNVDRDTNLDRLRGLVSQAVAFGRISASKIKAFALDAATHCMMVISYAHHEIHSGTHYVFRSYDTIARNGTKEILIITPDTTKWGHVIIGFDMLTSTTVVELFEGVTVSDNGKLGNTRNRNRNVADNNTVLTYEGPTVTGGAIAANIIQDGIFGAGRNSFGGGARDNEEIILKQDTIYLLRFAEQNIAATAANYSVDWYEHTDRD